MPPSGNAFERQRVVAGRIDAAVAHELAEVEQRAAAGVGHEVLVVELERVWRAAAGELRLQAGEVVGEGGGLHLDRDVRVLGLEGGDDGVEVLEVIRCRREREVAEGHILAGGAGRWAVATATSVPWRRDGCAESCVVFWS